MPEAGRAAAVERMIERAVEGREVVVIDTKASLEGFEEQLRQQFDEHENEWIVVALGEGEDEEATGRIVCTTKDLGAVEVFDAVRRARMQGGMKVLQVVRNYESVSVTIIAIPHEDSFSRDLRAIAEQLGRLANIASAAESE